MQLITLTSWAALTWGMSHAWHSALHQQAPINVHLVPQPPLLLGIDWRLSTRWPAGLTWRAWLSGLICKGEEEGKGSRQGAKMQVPREQVSAALYPMAALGIPAFVETSPELGEGVTFAQGAHGHVPFLPLNDGLQKEDWFSCDANAVFRSLTLGLDSFSDGTYFLPVRCHCHHDSWDLLFPQKWFQARPNFFRFSLT